MFLRLSTALTMEFGLTLAHTYGVCVGGGGLLLLPTAQVVKVFGIVASADTFHEQHLVVNGCSDLLGEIFGKAVKYTHTTPRQTNKPKKICLESICQT
jgi:hypothetical protein